MLNQRQTLLANYRPPGCFYIAVYAYQCINRDDYYETFIDGVKRVLSVLSNLECTFVQSDVHACAFEIQLGAPCKRPSGANLFDLLRVLRDDAALDAASWQLLADRYCLFNRLTYTSSYLYKACQIAGSSISDGLARQLVEPARSPSLRRGDVILGSDLVHYNLTDLPCLFVPFGETRLPISFSTPDKGLPFAEFYLPVRDSHWRFSYTTYEMIPVFNVVLPELAENVDAFYSELVVFVGQRHGFTQSREVYLYPRSAAPDKQRVFTSPFNSDEENAAINQSVAQYTGSEYLRLVLKGQELVASLEGADNVD